MTAVRRLIVNADDFGRSVSINKAVIRAHREGILTTASLMVNEPDCAEAVASATDNPTLGVGLHLALVCGRSALPPDKIPGLVNAQGEFSNNPVAVGVNYFFKRSLREQLRAEIHEQFARFRATGLPLDHVNGHLHMHLHPVVLKILMEAAEQFNIRHMRLTREPFWMDVPLARGRRLYRTVHAAIYFVLGGWRAQSQLKQKHIRHAQRVFGLLQNDRVDTAYLRKLLAVLPEGDSELYSHPSLDKFRHEFEALVDSDIRATIQRLGIRLIRYQDL